MPDPGRLLGTFSQFIYDFHCNRHSRKNNFDIILHLGYTSDSVWYRFWDKDSIHIVNMDGQEWKRAKYNRAVRAFLKYAEKLATRRADWLVADSEHIRLDLVNKYKVPVRYIAYGAKIPGRYLPGEISRMGLEPFKYDLIIARMEPENNIEMAIRAKIDSGSTVPLVIVGNENKYRQHLVGKYFGVEAIRFVEAVYDEQKINSLRHFSRIYVHGHSAGGTNPSLLEAMACSCRIVAHKNPFNQFVLGDDAFYYKDSAELASLINNFNAGDYERFIARNLEKIRQEYNWESVTDAYEKLFLDAIRDH